MTLIEKAERIILKIEDEIYYDRVYFDVKEISPEKVEISASIDGGPHIATKECQTENDIHEFIKEYNI